MADGPGRADFSVSSVTERPFRRSPAPPFMTSTLQQEAARKLRFSAQRAMQVAQRLYEQGYITYMRTDSTTLSDEALTAAAARPAEYGDAYVPDAPRRYERKVKNAQEAHEAIRPSGETFRTPEQVGRDLSGDELRLYEMIWMRTVASQMNDATGTSAQVRLVADVPRGAGRGPGGRVLGQRPGDHLRRVPRGVRGGPRRRRSGRQPRTGCCPRFAEGDRVAGIDVRAGVAHHAAAGPLHRGLARQGDGGARRRAALDLRQRHADHPRPRLRVEEGDGARPELHRLRRGGLLERYFTNLVDYGFTASWRTTSTTSRRGPRRRCPG